MCTGGDVGRQVRGLGLGLESLVAMFAVQLTLQIPVIKKMQNVAAVKFLSEKEK